MKGLTVAGHVAIDQVINENGEYVQLGGPPCFCSALGKALGFKVNVKTKIGHDFPDELVSQIKSLGIETQYRSASPTTRFVLDYRHEPRRLSVQQSVNPSNIQR